jgi:glycosyltransferase involved in cell wall biosynthesis
MLKEALNTILAQSFTDYEVIVGNDYTTEELTGEMLGITDPRIRIINHSVNLREVGNMNSLLAEASGRYFTWLIDDDLYEPVFLENAHNLLTSNNFPPALFSSYRELHGNSPFQPTSFLPYTQKIMDGRDYLDQYFAGHIKIISTCGLYDTRILREIVGGVEELCDFTYGLYCEYLLLVRCALLERIAYLDAPYVIFRVHDSSWGEINTELGKYIEAGRALMNRCSAVLNHPTLVENFSIYLLAIVRIHLVNYATKSVKLELERSRFCIVALGSALSRFSVEARNVWGNFQVEGGQRNFRIRLGFLKHVVDGYILILLILRNFWWRQIVKKPAMPRDRP